MTKNMGTTNTWNTAWTWASFTGFGSYGFEIDSEFLIPTSGPKVFKNWSLCIELIQNIASNPDQNNITWMSEPKFFGFMYGFISGSCSWNLQIGWMGSDEPDVGTAWPVIRQLLWTRKVLHLWGNAGTRRTWPGIMPEPEYREIPEPEHGWIPGMGKSRNSYDINLGP